MDSVKARLQPLPAHINPASWVDKEYALLSVAAAAAPTTMASSEPAPALNHRKPISSSSSASQMATAVARASQSAMGNYSVQAPTSASALYVDCGFGGIIAGL